MKDKTLTKLFFSFLIVAGFSLLASTGVSAQNKDDDDKPVSSKLAKKAKITMEQAREIALKRVPGTVLEGELEKEKGKLVYSFDIRATADSKIMEVNVDAKTGEIVLVEEDNEDDDDGKDDDG